MWQSAVIKKMTQQYINQWNNGATIYEECIYSVAQVCIEVMYYYNSNKWEYSTIIHTWGMHWEVREVLYKNDRSTNSMISWHKSGFRKNNVSFACKCITQRQFNTDTSSLNRISGLEEKKRSCSSHTACWWIIFDSKLHLNSRGKKRTVVLNWFSNLK